MTKLTGIRIVADTKVTRYLLALDHPVGAPKARYLMAFGFEPSAPHILETALLVHADRHPIHAERGHGRGINREIRCSLDTPDGRNPCFVTIWFQATGENTQRLVTACPAP